MKTEKFMKIWDDVLLDFQFKRAFQDRFMKKIYNFENDLFFCVYLYLKNYTLSDNFILNATFTDINDKEYLIEMDLSYLENKIELESLLKLQHGISYEY